MNFDGRGAMVAMACLAAFAASAPAASKRAEAAAAKLVTEDSRSLVSMKVGQSLEIQLRAQPGTGFSWVAARQVPGLKEMKPVKGARQMPGSAQLQRFRFTPERKGTYRLGFSYDQPWRGGTKNARTKGFVVVAR